MKIVQVNHPIIDLKTSQTWNVAREAISCYVEENEAKLKIKQLQVYEEVFRSVNNEESRIYFLDALRGTEVRGAKELKPLFR